MLWLRRPFSKDKNQRQAVFNWLSGIVGEEDLVMVDENGRREFFGFEFPLKLGDLPRRLKYRNESEAAFYVNFSSSLKKPINQNWRLVFSFPGLEIYYDAEKIPESRRGPLTWRLNDKEKEAALRLARNSLEYFFEKGDYVGYSDDIKFTFFLPKALNARKTEVAVALWTEGALRGFSFWEKGILSEVIIKASISAACNPGFKPLTAEELPLTRIEISVISDFKIPLGYNTNIKTEPFYDKGFLLAKEKKKKWFLPQFFNFPSNVSYQDVIFEFLHQNWHSAVFPPEVDSAESFIFEVDDFIERESFEGFSELKGPIIKRGPKNVELDMRRMAFSAAAWILEIQESDGNFIPIFNPFSGPVNQFDSSRSALTGWGLIEFGKIVNNEDYLGAGQRNFLYLKNHFLKNHKIIDGAGDIVLNLSFLGEMALTLGRWPEVRWCASKILERESVLKFEPVVFSQAGGFLASLAKNDSKFFDSASRFATILNQQFEINLRAKKSMVLPAWSGIVELFLKMFEATANDYYLKLAEKAAIWLLNYRFESGAFRMATDSDFVYTRGTAKIAENLTRALNFKNRKIDSIFSSSYYEKCLRESFGWLEGMQYSPENSHFIPVKNRKFVIGGFRHDYFSPNLWIDAAGHFLLAASRFLKKFNNC